MVNGQMTKASNKSVRPPSHPAHRHLGPLLLEAGCVSDVGPALPQPDGPKQSRPCPKTYKKISSLSTLQVYFINHATHALYNFFSPPVYYSQQLTPILQCLLYFLLSVQHFHSFRCKLSPPPRLTAALHHRTPKKKKRRIRTRRVRGGNGGSDSQKGRP